MDSRDKNIYNEYFISEPSVTDNQELNDIDFDINWYWTDYQQTEYYEDENGKKSTRKVSQRQAANMRERKRMRTINDAFEGLRAKVPFANDSEKKLSKVDTLRLAVQYIQHLANVLESCGVSTASKRKRMGESNGKVILKCSTNNMSPLPDSLLSQPVYGHSLSWNIENQQFKKRKKFSAQIWIPYQINAQEQAELSSDF
ncbi:unnamed protein product [Dimorphilus gyrociliatus]|uniref:BHLH domain-containing protein n=1 Tax=Dimorphilus gyrociliatus TaxID=2664684 RepID=A0A7I8W361_9ANNE|nr:unnamed protein product [Dimorphilus gyrociliatus]